MKTEVIRSSETSLHIRPTRRYIPENGNIQVCESCKEYQNFQRLLNIFRVNKFMAWKECTGESELVLQGIPLRVTLKNHKNICQINYHYLILSGLS
jgi:hypothetical protein